MKRMKLIALGLVGVVTLGLGGGWLYVRSWLSSNLTADNVVQQIEAQWNCRASVKELEASLFASPAHIKLTDLVLGPRDGEMSKPRAQRAPMRGALITVHAAELEIDTSDLLHQRLHIRKLHINGIDVRDEVSPEGVSILNALFVKPAPASVAPVVAATPTPATAEAPPPSALPSPPAAGDKPKAKEPKAPHAESPLPFGIVADELLLEQGKAHLVNRQSKTTIDAKLDRLRISGVDLDASDLVHHNRCKVELAGHVTSSARKRVADAMTEVQLADIEFSGQGELHPIDATTGKFDPDAMLSLVVKKGSVLGGNTTIGEAAGKDKNFANMKNKFGIDLDDVKIGGELLTDAVADARLHQGRLDFIQDLVFTFPDRKVLLHKGSWINGAHDEHELSLRLTPEKALADRITDGVTKKLGTGMTKLAVQIFNDGDNHLAFDIISTGKLSKPAFKLGGQAGSIEQLLKGVGGDLFKGLFK
jgi:hypothetical protein